MKLEQSITSKIYFEKKKEFSYKNFYHKDKKKYCKLSYKIKDSNKKAFIWIHGFNDYFYHFHISDLLYESSYDFYHITLHNYGETLTDKRYYTDDLRNYFIDIDNSLEYIIKKNYEKLFLYGHSLGGLITSVYCLDGTYREIIDGLILNSPFYDFYNTKKMEFLIKNVAYYIGKYFPTLSLRKADKKPNSYSAEILKKFYFEPNLKLVHNSEIYAGWITTVINFQQLIKNNKLKIDIPVLIFYSNKSDYSNTTNCDNVLDVKEIDKYCNNLSNHITKIEINKGIHDIFTSDKEPLDKSIFYLLKWLKQFS